MRGPAAACYTEGLGLLLDDLESLPDGSGEEDADCHATTTELLVRSHLSLSKLLLESGEPTVALDHVRAALLHLDQREELLEECTRLDADTVQDTAPYHPRNPPVHRSLPRALQGLLPVAWGHLTLVLHNLGRSHLALAAQNRATLFQDSSSQEAHSLASRGARSEGHGFLDSRDSSGESTPRRVICAVGGVLRREEGDHEATENMAFRPPPSPQKRSRDAEEDQLSLEVRETLDSGGG